MLHTQVHPFFGYSIYNLVNYTDRVLSPTNKTSVLKTEYCAHLADTSHGTWIDVDSIHEAETIFYQTVFAGEIHPVEYDIIPEDGMYVGNFVPAHLAIQKQCNILTAKIRAITNLVVMNKKTFHDLKIASGHTAPLFSPKDMYIGKHQVYGVLNSNILVILDDRIEYMKAFISTVPGREIDAPAYVLDTGGVYQRHQMFTPKPRTEQSLDRASYYRAIEFKCSMNF